MYAATTAKPTVIPTAITNDDNLAVNACFTNAMGDELGVLRSKVEYYDCLVLSV
jgi:hypothetical protein